VAIKIPYYDALVRMGLNMHRGPGQEMMHIIKKTADEKGIKIKNARIIKSGKKD
jgi:hypothetical protein